MKILAFDPLRSFQHMLQILLALLSLLAGCAPLESQTAEPDQTSTPEIRNTASPLPTSTTALWPPSPMVTETPPQSTPEEEAAEQTQIHLFASLDYNAHLLAVDERVTYVNTAAGQIDSLTLILEPQRRTEHFELQELSWQDGVAIEPFTLQEGVLQIPLTEPLQPGAAISLKLVFSYYLPEQLSSLGYSARQANLADWYAFFPPYDLAEGWMLRAPAAVGENLLYDLADYQVEIRLVGDAQGLMVAASAPLETAGSPSRYINRMARNFSWSVSPDYVMLQDSSASTMIQAYVFPEHLNAGQMALGYVHEALEVYTGLFGPAGLPALTVVEVEFPDGMEYDGLFFLNQLYFTYPGSGPQSGLSSLSVHETAHQWWYRLVSNDPAEEPWLDEALCTFSELLFYEQKYPEMVSWWWEYRIEDYQPQGWVNSTIYEHFEYRPYVNAVYLQGVRFLDALRRLVGEQTMFDFLGQYAQTYRYQQADAEQFFDLLDALTDRDIQPVVEEYFNLGR